MAVNSTNRRRRKQEATRARLLDGAARVFARRGYHAATLEEVATDVGLTKGAVYSNFTSKEALFLALVDVEIGKRVAEVARVVDARGSLETLQAEAERQFQRFVREEPHWPLLFYEFFSYGARSEQLRKEFTKRRRAVFHAIAQGLQRQADEAGIALPIPAEQVAVAIGALMNGLAFDRVVDPRAVPDGLFGLVMSRLIFAIVTTDPADVPASVRARNP
jgi:AcrR family transcriptional regulator